MNLPKILILNDPCNELETFLRKEGLDISIVNDLGNLKDRLAKEQVGLILVSESGKIPLSSLYKILLDVSPDTKVIIYGKGSKGSKNLNPYWIYRSITWPSDNKFSVLEIVKNAILEYYLVKRERISIQKLLSYTNSYNNNISANILEKSIDNFNLLQIFRAFNIELSTCIDIKRAINITKKYIEKLFDMSFLCIVLKLNKDFLIFAFETNKYEFKHISILEKYIENLIIVNNILTGIFIKKEYIKEIYINNKRVFVDIKVKHDELLKLRINSKIIFPLIAGTENLGCISIGSEKQNIFDVNDIRKFSFIAYQLASVLLNIKLISQIRDISIKDALTNLYNRRYFDEILQHEYLRSKRYHLPLSLIMIDIDFFKFVNDTFGHLVGDKVLKKLANLIRNSVRQVDIVARFGGEEFAIILLNTSLEEAAHMAERLRGIVEKYSFDINSNNINITISAGISTLKEDTTSKDELVDHADKALLKAKANGRNKVYMYINEKEIKEVKTKGLRERRRFKRIATNFLLNYMPLTTRLKKPKKVLSRDISEEGICFIDVTDIQKGELLMLDFDITVNVDDNQLEDKHIKALAQVVWTKKENNKFIIGAKLITLNPEDRLLIRNLCK